MLRVLDLFSGIGGFSLGLERTGGFQTVAFCEIEPFPRAVLRKHWPEVPCYHDVRKLTAKRLAADGIVVDVICRGFPCQDISIAGNGAGLDGERSGLWSEFSRLIGELRPRFVLVENVSALLHRGLDRVLGDLAEIGFDAEWHCIPAAAVGAPHRRDRVWLVGYPDGGWQPVVAVDAEMAGVSGMVADADGAGCQEQRFSIPISAELAGIECGGETVADAASARGPRRLWGECAGRVESGANGWWLSEPDVGRVANGVPARMDRLRSLGNAVVPQIPEMIGRAILASL